MPTFYDTHAHLDYPDFSAELPDVIQRAQAAGITRIISIGTNLESSARAVKLAEQFLKAVFAVIGSASHRKPSDAPDDLRPSLRELARHPKVVAIGETGLDYYRMPSAQPGKTAEDDIRYKHKQAQIFQQQLEVAAEFGLNCVVHQRSALEDTLAQMQPFVGRVRRRLPIVLRTTQTPSVGSSRWAASSVSPASSASKNAQSIRDTAAATPLDQFMLETDCPYLAPVPYRGKRCEPAFVKEISEVVAKVKKMFPRRTQRRHLCDRAKVLSATQVSGNIQPDSLAEHGLRSELLWYPLNRTKPSHSSASARLVFR